MIFEWKLNIINHNRQLILNTAYLTSNTLRECL